MAGVFERLLKFKNSENNNPLSEECTEDKLNLKDIYSKVQGLHITNNLLQSEIAHLKEIYTIILALMGIIIAILAFLLPIILNIHTNNIDKNIDAYNTKVISKFELIQKELSSQKENNSLQIQRDVAIEIKNQKK